MRIWAPLETSFSLIPWGTPEQALYHTVGTFRGKKAGPVYHVWSRGRNGAASTGQGECSGDEASGALSAVLVHPGSWDKMRWCISPCRLPDKGPQTRGGAGKVLKQQKLIDSQSGAQKSRVKKCSSLQHYSQWPRHRSNRHIHRQRSG